MKTLKNLLKIAIPVGVLGLSSCKTYRGLDSDSLHATALKNYAPLTKEQTDSMFREFSPGLKESIKNVYIINPEDFYNETTIAHTHRNGTLCTQKYLYDEIHFHELAHVKTFELEKNKSDFLKKWKEISNFKYGQQNIDFQWRGPPFNSWDVNWKDGAACPKDGMLEPYSATDIYEDVANFVECLGYEETPEKIKKEFEKINPENPDSLALRLSKIEKEMASINLRLSKIKSYQSLDFYFLTIKKDELMSQYYGSYSASLASFSLYFADTSDHRYKKKLDLLLEYNFLTNEEHKNLSKNLGSLKYLLKESEK